MSTIWNTIIYNPIYNALIFIAQHVTGQDVGLAVIVLTIIIRLALFPLSKKEYCWPVQNESFGAKITNY